MLKVRQLIFFSQIRLRIDKAFSNPLLICYYYFMERVDINRYIAEILPVQCKTPSIQSINQSINAFIDSDQTEVKMVKVHK